MWQPLLLKNKYFLDHLIQSLTGELLEESCVVSSLAWTKVEKTGEEETEGEEGRRQ